MKKGHKTGWENVTDETDWSNDENQKDRIRNDWQTIKCKHDFSQKILRLKQTNLKLRMKMIDCVQLRTHVTSIHYQYK